MRTSINLRVMFRGAGIDNVYSEAATYAFCHPKLGQGYHYCLMCAGGIAYAVFR